MMKLTFGQQDFLVSKFKAGALIAVLWVVMLTGSVLLSVLGTRAYVGAKQRLSDQAITDAHLIAEHDRFGFRLADVILQDIADHLRPEDFSDALSLERRAQLLRLLREHRDRLPGIASFTLIGPDGIRRIGIVGKDGTDLSDRGYFKANRDGQDFFISNIEDGRASGKPGIHVTRRINTPDGRFGGVVEMNLAAEDIFFSYYRTLDLGPHYTTTLRDPDRILISYPTYQLSAGHIKGRDDVGAQIAGGLDRGVLAGLDPVDGAMKITAFERLAGTGLYATASLPTGPAMLESRTLAGGALLAAVACLFGALGATSAIAKAHALARARDAAAKADRERQLLIRQLQSVAEEERRSISHEIHDVLNAIVWRMKIDAQAIVKEIGNRADLHEMGRRAKSITEQACELYTQARALVKRLRPEVLDVLGLDQAVDEMVRGYAAAHPACRFSFQASGDMGSIDGSVSISVYRVVQEALSNIIKHSNATVVGVELRRNEQAETLELRVSDNGRGFNAEAPTAGVGLVGMRERIAAFGGHMIVDSYLAEGTTVRALIPASAVAATVAID